MYKGLKKKYTREEYVKLALTLDRNKCYFCLHNRYNYSTRPGSKMSDIEMDRMALDYFTTICSRCINHPQAKNAVGYLGDNFKTLYDWGENNDKGVNNA